MVSKTGQIWNESIAHPQNLQGVVSIWKCSLGTQYNGWFWRCKKSPSPFTLPTDIYLLKVNNRNTRTRYEICSKSIVLLFLFLALNRFHTLIKCFYYWLWTRKFPFCVCLCFRFHHHHLHSHILPQRVSHFHRLKHWNHLQLIPECS